MSAVQKEIVIIIMNRLEVVMCGLRDVTVQQQSETRMTASVLKQDPSTYTVENNASH